MSEVGKINTSLSSNFNVSMDNFGNNSSSPQSNYGFMSQYETLHVTTDSIELDNSLVMDSFADVSINRGVGSAIGNINTVVVEETDLFRDVGARVGATVEYLFNNLESTMEVIYNWWNEEAYPFIMQTVNSVCDILENVAATVTTALISLVEGLGTFVEAIIDCGAVVSSIFYTQYTVPIDAVQALYGLITGNEWESITKSMWNDTTSFVSTKYVTGWFDKLYEETAFGIWLSDNSYLFDGVRSVGSGVGYVAGIIILTLATAGLGGVAVGGSSAAGSAAGATVTTVTSTQVGITAGLAGFGQGTEQAWAEGANEVEGLVYGGANAAWEFFQFWVGGEISKTGGLSDQFAEKVVSNASSVLTNRLVASFGRVIADGVTGGFDGIVRPALSMIYKKGYYDDDNNYVEFDDLTDVVNNYGEIFDDSGGWANVLTNALVGSVSSAFGEAFELNNLGRNSIEKSMDGVNFSESEFNNSSSSYKVPTENVNPVLKDLIDEWNENGFVNMDIGKKIENFLMDDNYYYGVHRTCGENVATSIYNDGLFLTGHSSSGVGLDSDINLDLNISFARTSEDPVLKLASFLYDIKSSSYYKNYTGDGIGYAMIVKVPKNAIDSLENVSSSIIDYSSGYPTLKSEYIVGKIEVNNGNIFDSPNTVFKDDK